MRISLLRSPKLRAWHALVPVAALVSMASYAQSPPEPPLGAGSFSSHASLEAIWMRATDDRPLGAEALTFLTTNIGAGAASKPAGGLIPVGGGLIPPGGSTPTGDVRPTALLPVVSPAADLARESHRRAALLELLLTALQGYREPDATGPVDAAEVQARQSRGEDRRAWASTAHLELFLEYASFYLEGETKSAKCRAFDRASEHARFLGWRPEARTGSAPNVPLRPSFRALHAQAWSFYTGAFATSIPPKLCELEPAVTRADDEATAKGEVVAAIGTRVASAIDAQIATLAGPEQRFKALDDRSQVAVPTRDIFNLKRSVEDSASLYQFVQSDALLLETGSLEAAQKALVEQVEAQGARLAEIERDANASTLHLDEGARAARADLEKYNLTIARIVSSLKEAAALPGLDAATRASLQPCASLPSAITIENTVTFAAALGQCLQKVGEAYTTLKGRVGSDPDYVLFTQKTTALSEAYIGYFKSQPR